MNSMPNPSPASYKAATGRYYRRMKEIRDAFDADGSIPSVDEVKKLVRERHRLTEVYEYLQERTDPSETLKQWRERRAITP